MHEESVERQLSMIKWKRRSNTMHKCHIHSRLEDCPLWIHHCYNSSIVKWTKEWIREIIIGFHKSTNQKGTNLRKRIPHKESTNTALWSTCGLLLWLNMIWIMKLKTENEFWLRKQWTNFQNRRSKFVRRKHERITILFLFFRLKLTLYCI